MLIPKSFKSNDFVRAHCKGLAGAFFVSAHSKGLTGLNTEPPGLAEPASQEVGWSVATPGGSTAGDHNLLRGNECAEFFTGFRNLVRDDSGYRKSAGRGCASCGISDLGKESAPFPTGSESSIGSARRSRSPVRDNSGYRKVANSDCAPYPFSQPAVWKKQRSRRLTPGMTGGCTPSISALNAGNFGPSPPGGERRVRWCAITRPGQPRVRRLIARSARSERWY